MCELFDQYTRRGKQEGRQEGRQEGMRFLIIDNLEEGKPEEIIVQKLMRWFALGQEEAKAFYDQCVIETASGKQFS